MTIWQKIKAWFYDDAPEEKAEDLLFTINPQNKAHRYAIGRYGHCYELFVDVTWPHGVDVHIGGKHVVSRVDVDSAITYCNEQEYAQFLRRDAF